MFSDERILYAPVYCWKGMFEVFDVLSHVHNGIQAHFPRIVCHRAYDVFKKIPEKLKLKEVPRKVVWPHIFQVDPPDKDDIGLYFFPDKLERRKDKYIRLLERIDLHDSAMRSSINEAELLVFSSKMLPVDSQRIDGQAYLWGVLRGVKNRKPGQHIKKHFPPCNPPPAAVGSKNCSISSAPFIGNVEEVDMEIDMIGGKEVGIMDKPIPRVDIPPGFIKQVGMTDKPTPRVDIPPALTKQVSMRDKPISRVDIPPGFTKPYSRAVNPENRLLSPFPPGFSKIPKFNCQSISLKANDKGSIVSKMDSSGLVSSTTRGGDVATPKEPVMQPDYHQVSDHQEKVAGHLKSSIASPTSEFNFGKSEGQGCDVIVPNVPKESEDKEIMEIHSIPLSLVSASYNSPSCSPERQLPSAVQSKIAVLDKCVFENEIEEEKAAGKSISDIKIKQIALVSASYDSSQSSPEPKLSSKGTPMLTLFPEEADPEFKRGTVQMDLELDISRSAPSISPDLSLSRPQYVNDGHVWISNNSRDRLKRDDCGKELQLSLLSCQRRL